MVTTMTLTQALSDTGTITALGRKMFVRASQYCPCATLSMPSGKEWLQRNRCDASACRCGFPLDPCLARMLIASQDLVRLVRVDDTTSVCLHRSPY